MNTSTATHTPHPTRQMPADENGRGNLAGFEAACSCGFIARDTFRFNAELDLRAHALYMAGKLDR